MSAAYRTGLSTAAIALLVLPAARRRGGDRFRRTTAVCTNLTGDSFRFIFDMA